MLVDGRYTEENYLLFFVCKLCVEYAEALLSDAGGILLLEFRRDLG